MSVSHVFDKKEPKNMYIYKIDRESTQYEGKKTIFSKQIEGLKRELMHLCAHEEIDTEQYATIRKTSHQDSEKVEVLELFGEYTWTLY